MIKLIGIWICYWKKRTDRVIEEKIDQEECVPMSVEMKDKLQKILEKG